jgi:hypothetical protein
MMNLYSDKEVRKKILKLQRRNLLGKHVAGYPRKDETRSCKIREELICNLNNKILNSRV